MKLLALDGGGVFGRIQSRILAEANCFDKFDAFVGTSIGAPQVLAISLGKQSLVRPEFFDKWMTQIFYRSWLRKTNPFMVKYDDKGLNAALQAIFGSSMLGDAKKPVFITAADIGQKTLKVFSSQSFDDKGWLAWEVCRAATAAETYFPAWKGYADGGIYANNPSMVGLAAVVRVLGAKMEDVEILSIGTGESSTSVRPPSSRLGVAVWVLQAMLNGASDKMHDYFVKSLPVKKYTRIQFAADPKWEMDEPKNMYYAERRWIMEIQAAIQTVKNF